MTQRFLCSMSLFVGLIVFAGGSSPRLLSPASDGIYFGSSIPSTQVVDNDAVLTGDQVDVDGKVNGNVLAVGTDISINGEVQGSLIAIGQKVSINGTVNGSVYAAAVEMNLGPSAVINQNIFYGGLSLVSDQGSLVRRDLYAGSLGAQLSGTISRNINAVIGPVNLIQNAINALGGKMVLPTPRPPTPGGSNIVKPGYTGQIASPDSIAWIGAFTQNALVTSRLGSPSGSPVGNPQRASSPGDISNQFDITSVTNWAVIRLREFVTIALIGLTAIWLMPALFHKAAEKLRNKPYSAGGYGLLELILALNLSGVIGLVGLIVFIIGLWLGPRVTWTLSGIIWAIGFFGTGLALVAIWLFVFFISKAIVAYFGGKLILERLSPQAAHYRVIPLLIGLLIYVLIASIPMLGWVFDVAVIALGLGAAWLAFRRQPQSQAVLHEINEAEQASPGEGLTSPLPVTGDSHPEQ